jgi:hypothetical protein
LSKILSCSAALPLNIFSVTILARSFKLAQEGEKEGEEIKESKEYREEGVGGLHRKGSQSQEVNHR